MVLIFYLLDEWLCIITFRYLLILLSSSNFYVMRMRAIFEYNFVFCFVAISVINCVRVIEIIIMNWNSDSERNLASEIMKDMMWAWWSKRQGMPSRFQWFNLSKSCTQISISINAVSFNILTGLSQAGSGYSNMTLIDIYNALWVLRMNSNHRSSPLFISIAPRLSSISGR